MFDFENYSIRTKLIIALFVIGLVSVTVMGIATSLQVRSTLEQNTYQVLEGAARQTATNLDNFINTNLDAVRVESQLPIFIEVLQSSSAERADNPSLMEEATLTLQTLSRKDANFIGSYALYDENGNEILNTDDLDPSQNRASVDYFQETIQSNRPYVSSVRRAPEGDFKVLYFSNVVRDDNRTVLGVLRVRYNANILQRIVAQSFRIAGDLSFAMLFDENLIRLAHGDSPSLIGQLAFPRPEAEIRALQAQGLLLDGSVNSLSTNTPDLRDGLENILNEQGVAPYFEAQANLSPAREFVAAVQMESQPWLVAVAQSETIFNAPRQSQLRVLLTVAAFLAVLIFAIAWGIAGYFASPITQLTQTAQRIAAGDLNLQARVQTQDEMGQLAIAFNQMTTQLRQAIDQLEDRVRQRTQRLETVANLSEYLMATLNLEDLLQELVDRIKNDLGYYHAHIYLLDDTGTSLVVAAGVGQAGADMKARNHSIDTNAATSLVAQAYRTADIVRIGNVTQSPSWLRNPLLPDTKSEIAVPVTLNNEVVGVLDVQENRFDGFDRSDVSVLRSLANQVAIAMRNAAQFTQLDTALREARQTQERYVERAWSQGRFATETTTYTYQNSPASLKPDLVKAVQQQLLQNDDLNSEPIVVSVDEDHDGQAEHTPLAAPLTISGQAIGALQLYRTHNPDRPWTDEEREIVIAVVDQVIQVAENLRLFEETREQASREQLISRISDRMRRAPDVETLMSITVSELSAALGTARTFVQLGSENTFTPQEDDSSAPPQTDQGQISPPGNGRGA